MKQYINFNHWELTEHDDKEEEKWCRESHMMKWLTIGVWIISPTDPPPATQPNSFFFLFPCFLALLYCFYRLVRFVLWYEIVYVILRLEVFGLIQDRFFFFSFFNSLFLVPPSMMGVVFLACSRYYHQLWILPFSSVFWLPSKDSRARIWYSASTNGTFFILCLIMEGSYYLKRDLNSLIRQFQNVGPEFDVLRNWYKFMLLWAGLMGPSIGYPTNLRWLSCHMK